MDPLGDTAPFSGLRPPPLGRVLWFGARFGCAFALLLAPWPQLGEVYGAAATALGNAALSCIDSPRTQLAFSQPTAAGAFSTVLHAKLLRSGHALQIPIELQTLTFIPSACLIALLLADAWRRPLRRTGIHFALSMLALQAFLFSSLLVPLCLFFAEPEPMQLIELSPSAYIILTVLYRSLVTPPGMIYAVPFAIWLLVRTHAPAIPTRPSH